jgi:hypothetical protein
MFLLQVVGSWHAVEALLSAPFGVALTADDTARPCPGATRAQDGHLTKRQDRLWHFAELPARDPEHKNTM